MAKSIYLINPSSDFPTYFSTEVLAAQGFSPAAFMADLAVTALAAMFSKTLNVLICDENTDAIDFDADVDFVGITGKITQRDRMIEVAREFRRRGKTILIGGPYASLSPGSLRDHCDILIRGEAEEILDGIASDLEAGCWKDEYIGGKPDLSLCAMPAWELYRNNRALMGTVQTSRGCPFECEFCDVIQYLGRKQRHKPIPQVLAELDKLYRHGYRYVFLADDNFTIARSRAKELLLALKDWNGRQSAGQVSFGTQVSIDAAKDDELLKMCAEAGLNNVFIGIETPNEDSLRESKKRQNLGINLVDQIRRFFNHGINVVGGMIVGFDSDRADIFETQYQFAMTSSIPILSVGALVAPEATPLYQRMMLDGRLDLRGSEVAAMPWSTNIFPLQMTQEELMRGIRWLCNSLYRPAAIGERMVTFIEKLENYPTAAYQNKTAAAAPLRPIDLDVTGLILNLLSSGPEAEKMYANVCKAAAQKPHAERFVINTLMQYSQIRYMYKRGNFWDTNNTVGFATPKGGHA